MTQPKFKSFADALTAQNTPQAANDNKPTKKPELRYRGTLPALRWLYDNHPELAEPVAEAVQSLSTSNWDVEAGDDYLEIRPTIGELLRAVVNKHTGEEYRPEAKRDKDGNAYIQFGELKFVKGQLVEYGKTKKGRKLTPRDKTRARTDEPSKARNPRFYVFKLRSTTPSPLHAEPYQRPFSGEPALPPMYDPQRGVETTRATLQAFGVDGSVKFEDLPFPATRCPTAIAKGAEFLGGIAQPSGNSSSGAVNLGELPEAPKGEVRKIVEDIASGATLKDIGERMGYGGSKYAIEVGRTAVKGAAVTLVAANDNNFRKNRKAA
ncbi:hypothetical protein [Mesorhizobium retamae]|uniref:Uncharacterized protein n=1 Tax=Mesorhizobium retamae TaxID=2912854 RepID=A0ABS9QI32_9HYPH|nr:hypothetical protein [Mesorhizobium sp. IRAMC:0171]MCG7507076.1 hypothetical protein [Mesorhizobium sp. IRAMC:0171]